MLLLKNGQIHTMTQEDFSGDILIDNGKIIAVGTNLSSDGAEVIELGGKFVLPGMISARNVTIISGLAQTRFGLIADLPVCRLNILNITFGRPNGPLRI